MNENALALWSANPDRGADGTLRVLGAQGYATVAAVAQDPDSPMLLVWEGPNQGQAPVRLLDPLGGDPGRTIAALLGSQTEAGR